MRGLQNLEVAAHSRQLRAIQLNPLPPKAAIWRQSRLSVACGNALSPPSVVKNGVPSFSDGTPCASFYILQGGIPFFAGTYLDNILNIVDKDLAVADMSGV